MRKAIDRLLGMVQVEICGLFPEAVLNLCAQRALSLEEPGRPDAYTLQTWVRERDLKDLENLCRQGRCEMRVLVARGGSRHLRLLRRRWALLLAAILVGAGLWVSSLFIWEIEVQGCERLSQGKVLRALADCGVEQGSYWPSLTVDLVRSRMLSRMPEVAWMTVNVSGSRAVVLIQERMEKPEIYAEQGVSDLVAERTGIVARLRVENGYPLVQEGQTVVQGETLVSGTVENLSGPSRELRARGSVLADTWYECTAVCPPAAEQKEEILGRSSRFALKLGRRRINFYRKGKKTLDGCDRIVHEYKIGIEGLFALPLTLVREDCIQRQSAKSVVAPAGPMAQRLRSELQEGIDGEVLSAQTESFAAEGGVYVTLRAHCREEIARNQERTQPGEAPA
ncbi:MAG: sporulation protein YqfD [Oscillospiraceae bacterium]|nr:sporulation protein YqfD [Oscillospiraceae bacterium]